MAEKAQPSVEQPTDLPGKGGKSGDSSGQDVDSTARSRVAMLRSKAQWRIEPQPADKPAKAGPARNQPAADTGRPAVTSEQDETTLPQVSEVAPQPQPTESGQPPALQALKQQIAKAAGVSPDTVDASAGGTTEPPRESWHLSPSNIDFEDPLVSCLSTLATLLQRPISETALKSGLPHDAGAFTPELAIQAAERAGLSARVMRRPKLANILPLTLPCILLLKGKSACVLLRYVDGDKAEIVHPDGGTKTIERAALEADYSGYALFARAEFKFDARASDIRLTSQRAWFWGTLKTFWPIYNHVVVASIMINIFALASPLFIMNVYDRVVPNNAIETLWVLALGVITVFAFDFVMRNMRTYFVDVAGKNADVIIASRLLSHVMGMRLDQKPPSTGALANNLREFESLREFFTSGTLVALVDLPFIFLFVGVIWLIGGPLALIPLCAVPLVILVGYLLQFPLRSVVERTHRESSQKHALLFETIDGLETIKATAAESRVQKAWERFVGLTAESSGQARFISGLATTFAQTSINLVTVAVVIFGVHLIKEGDMTMGALVAATILTGRALQPLGAVATMLTRLQQSRVALKALDTIMDAPLERAPEKTFLHRPKLEGSIEFNKASFSYPNQEGSALNGITLNINPGERVGVLGRIGSGKSSLARLIIGLYEPSEGAVLMDGTDLRQIDPADLRRNIGYVSQDNYLFFGSVRDNIALGAPHVDDQAILRAASVAGVSDFLRNHPMGFDLPVGERGMGLSGGQRQAIVIARALVQDPPILLLDEPTSSMDNSSEAAFKEKLEQILPGKTLLLITHRGSLLSLVDRLIVVDNGKIVADGPKEEVLNALKKGQVRSRRGD